MKIAVLGTGMVGRTIAGALAELGHDVVIGTRDPQATLARTEPGHDGQPRRSPRGTPSTPEIDARHLRRRRAGSRARRQRHQRRAAPWTRWPRPAPANLAGKVLIDIANPLDFSQGLPPSLNPVEHRLPRRADPAGLPGRQGGEDR